MNSKIKAPFFSIITVNLNSGRLVENTITSVIGQSFKDFEHVLIDGGSTDTSYEILLANCDHFSYFCSEKDKGIYDAINKGVANSRGKYLILLHSGDCLADNKALNELSEYILNKPSNDIYMSNVTIGSSCSDVDTYRCYPCSIFKVSRLRYGIMPPHPAMFISRDFCNKVGPYNINYKIAGDFDFIVRAFQVKGVKFTYCNNTFIRMIGGGLSDRLFNKILLQKELLDSCKNNRIKTNHFLLLFRFLIKFPGIIPKFVKLKKIFKKQKK
jgi:glycosyltransferase involved in cell wall biosynthesis